MSTTTKTKPAPMLGQFGPTLDAFLLEMRSREVAGPALRVIANFLKSETFIKAAVADVRRRRWDAEQKRVRRLSRREPEPNKAIRSKLNRLKEQERLLQEARRVKNRKATSSALSKIRELTREIEADRAKQLQAAWAGHAIAETVSLALIRGEEVGETETIVSDLKRGKHGQIVRKKGVLQVTTERAIAKRVTSRTGLELAFTSGALDGGVVSAPALYAMGLKYRAAFEVVSMTGLGTTGEERIGMPRCKPSVGPSEAAFQAGETLRIYRMNMTRRQRQVADMICGQDMALKAAAAAIKAGLPATKKALVAALTVAWENRTIG